jgi:hypothetical protein
MIPFSALKPEDGRKNNRRQSKKEETAATIKND